MRELRVVGIEADGSHVICQDPGTAERFRIPADERLRAAARGDLSRLGQIEIEMESSLRPREIQARIRGGASVAEVAAMAGVGMDKIERFAHPVLLERTRATEMASLSHPLRDDGPADATLGAIVAESLTALGYNANEVEWDAWKGDDGYWVVQIAWQVGNAEHLAHWRYIPGSHGGTADPLDDVADELSHPEAIVPRRRLSPVATPELPPRAAPPHIASIDGHEVVTFDADRIIDAQRLHNTEDPSLDFVAETYGDVNYPDQPATMSVVEAVEIAETVEAVDAADTVEAEPVATDPEPVATDPEPFAVDAVAEPAAEESPVEESPAAEPAAEEGGPVTSDGETGTSSSTDEAESRDAAPEASNTEASNTDDDHAHGTLFGHDLGPKPADNSDDGGKPRHRKSKKPAVPAWEDVLLGVRSSGHN